MNRYHWTIQKKDIVTWLCNDIYEGQVFHVKDLNDFGNLDYVIEAVAVDANEKYLHYKTLSPNPQAVSIYKGTIRIENLRAFYE